jgi:hypothetical protein
MTELRVLFNSLQGKTQDIFLKVRRLGIEAISVFFDLTEKLPPYFESVAKFRNVNVNLFHRPAYLNERNWKEKLRKDCERNIVKLADLGINNYPWMIECNLYGYSWNPQVGRFVHRDRLIEHFNSFYEIAHDVNRDANVIVVPYPHPFINLNCGRKGWKDWWIKHGERMKFDEVGMDAHVGVWIPAVGRSGIYHHLLDSIGFLQERGYPVSYVEVGYPTTGFKPLLGWYGWGREKDQVNLLRTCFSALRQMNVPWMQICEFIDPAEKRIYDCSLLGDGGKVPKFLGFIPVLEELHWGILRKDGSEKLVCGWIRNERKESKDKGKEDKM